MSDGIYTRLAKAAGMVGPIAKGERNREQNFDFRSIEQITGKARSVFAELGIGVIPSRVISIESSEVTSKRGATGFRTVVTMAYKVGCDTDKGRDELEMEMAGEAVDYGDKSTSKAVQMAYKYALTEALLIGAEGDADAESHELAPREPEIPAYLLDLRDAADTKYGEDARETLRRTMESLGLSHPLSHDDCALISKELGL